MRIACLLFLMPALLPFPADAQTLKPAPPPKLTLAQALKTLPPGDGLTLTVAAEKVTLPDAAEPPLAGASTGDIAAAFGQITQHFGTITVIAPVTMTLLNTQPQPPDLTKGVLPMTALELLTASLDDAQWQKLTSASGLGLPDLTDTTQHDLFHCLFNRRGLWIGSEDPALRGVPQEKRPDVRDVSAEIETTRVRLGQTVDINLQDHKGKTLYFGEERPDAASRLHTYRPHLPALPASVVHAVTLKAAVLNTLKPSDLSAESKTLQVAVPLSGLKTIGDLVSRIGQKTGLELYADPHYAAKSLTLVGTASSASASDLLQAVCLCVTGTFRKVGPAYVLTDDLVGVGVRRKHLADWESQADATAFSMSQRAGAMLLERRGAVARTLPTFGDPLAVTPEQMALVADAPGMPGIPTMNCHNFPFAKLTPAQQSWMRQVAVSYNEKLHSGRLPEYMDADNLGGADLTHNVDFGVDYSVQFLVPSASAPVNTNLEADLWLLFFTGDTPEAQKDYAALEKAALATLPPAPPLSAVLRSGRIRAVFGHPRTAAGVDTLVSAMQKLGLNTLVLDVYSEGVNRAKTNAVGGTDILTEALNKTHGTGIAVYADLSLLSWGGDPPDTLRDLTIDGKNTREAFISDPVPKGVVPIRVSPAAPAVKNALTGLAQSLAARPGLAGFVWEDADDPGNLGYTSARRLLFLRSIHADPLDITPPSYSQADMALPLFDDDALDTSLLKQWNNDTKDFQTALLRSLQTAARPALILMDQQEPFGDSWLASWDNPALPPPVLRELPEGSSFPSKEKILRFTRRQSQVVVKRETVKNDGNTAMLAWQLQEDAKTLPSDGFVLDFSSDSVTQGAAPLDSLVQAVSAESKGAGEKRHF